MGDKFKLDDDGNCGACTKLSLRGESVQCHTCKGLFHVVCESAQGDDKVAKEISEMLQYGDSTRTLKLQETRYDNKYGRRAFSHVAPKLWNLLPKGIRDVSETDSFKTALKSFLMIRGEEYFQWINRR